MGGITAPLKFHGQILDELNFSCNHQAACNVLVNARNPAVITGNHCLPVAYMPQEEFMSEMCANGNAASRMIAQKCGYRFADKMLLYGAAGTYCWDVVAAAFLLEPELFETETADIVVDAKNLRSGRLERAGMGEEPRNQICFPKAKSRDAFQRAVYRSWKDMDIQRHQKAD